MQLCCRTNYFSREIFTDRILSGLISGGDRQVLHFYNSFWDPRLGDLISVISTFYIWNLRRQIKLLNIYLLCGKLCHVFTLSRWFHDEEKYWSIHNGDYDDWNSVEWTEIFDDKRRQTKKLCKNKENIMILDCQFKCSHFAN